MLPKLKDIDKAKLSLAQESYGIISFLFSRSKPIVFLMFCAVFMSILNSESEYVSEFRLKCMEATSSFYNTLSVPTVLFNKSAFYLKQALNAHKTLPSLINENQELKEKIELYKDMEEENKKLRNLLHFANHSIYFPVAAKVVSESFNGSKSRFLINAGASSGVSEGMAVVNDKGLIGTVIEVSEDSARVMALQDEQSNIPAIIKTINKRCIISGSNVINKSEVRIRYIKEDELHEGMEVVTSGDADLLPKNLYIGRVSKHKGFMVPEFKLQDLDYIIVLKSNKK